MKKSKILVLSYSQERWRCSPLNDFHEKKKGEHQRYLFLARESMDELFSLCLIRWEAIVKWNLQRASSRTFKDLKQTEETFLSNFKTEKLHAKCDRITSHLSTNKAAEVCGGKLRPLEADATQRWAAKRFNQSACYSLISSYEPSLRTRTWAHVIESSKRLLYIIVLKFKRLLYERIASEIKSHANCLSVEVTFYVI